MTGVEVILDERLTDLTELSDVPGPTGDALRAWLEDQRGTLASEHWFVLVDEL